jgi:hypothetical protein
MRNTFNFDASVGISPLSPQENQRRREPKGASTRVKNAHRPIMLRVSAVAACGGVFIRRSLVGMITKIV